MSNNITPIRPDNSDVLTGKGRQIAASYLRVIDNTLSAPEPFPFNHDAIEALQQAWQAERDANLSVYCDSIGAPGTIEKVRQITGLLKQVAEIAQSITDDPEECRRYEHWVDVYDNPLRPETFGKSPARG